MFFNEQTNFLKIKKTVCFYQKNEFTEQTFLPNEYNTEKSFSEKTKEFAG